MKLKFKRQQFQDDAVESITDCFLGQPLTTGIVYRVDPGRAIEPTGQRRIDSHLSGFKNADLAMPASEVLKNIRSVQVRQNLPVSDELKSTPSCGINLDVEMETGTGKTYCYIKTMFELNRLYGWSKFIVVVPSIAIREGVYKSLQNTAEHFTEQYGKKVRAFIYNSQELDKLESFSSDAGINVMIINVQAFNAQGEDARRIRTKLDDFQSRKPIDVIAHNRPILILDEPQKMEGAKTTERLKEFNPLMVLRYSATHSREHDKVYRLDALDAYSQKLVKKIGVRGITLKGSDGTSPYLYLESIQISPSRAPEARIEIEIKQKNSIKRDTIRITQGARLFEASKELEQYKGFVVSNVDPEENAVSFTNGFVLEVGEAYGDQSESALRRIQIREAIKAHFEKEQALFQKGIKVLTLFFIGEVAKYRSYTDGVEQSGEYAKAFEEEYTAQLNEILTLEDTAYNRYLRSIPTSRTHDGYFSIDKKTKHLVNPIESAKTKEADDVDAYDKILKEKETLLLFREPIRFIFSHSALREGWDNPNVFVICALKYGTSTVTRRQEVGRGLRLAVNQDGDRMDDPATVHQINVLTVVASESYKDFVAGLQKETIAALAARPTLANESYFNGKVLKTDFAGDTKVSPAMAKAIYHYLVKNSYLGVDDRVTAAYNEAKQDGKLAPLPPDLQPWTPQIQRLMDALLGDGQLPVPEDELKNKPNPLNQKNFEKKEFQNLWARINRKAAYTVHFNSAELIQKCVAAIDADLKVTPLQYTIQSGEQTATATYEDLKKGAAFEVQKTQTDHLKISAQSAVKYDLIGKIAAETQLKRATVGTILHQIRPLAFAQYRTNPEDFIRKAAQLINEQKATVIVEHLAYNPVDDTYSTDIFTQDKTKVDLSKAKKVDNHIWEYVFTDSKTEKDFVEQLDTGTDVEVYAKLPRSFFIPTPVGNYSPDWAIAFKQGSVKHIYFVAETKGSLSSMDLHEIEKSKIACARKFFAKITSDQVKYDVIDSYAKLMELVK